MQCPNTKDHPDGAPEMEGRGLTYLDGGGPWDLHVCPECEAEVYLPE
jgi:hypothetical protein